MINKELQQSNHLEIVSRNTIGYAVCLCCVCVCLEGWGGGGLNQFYSRENTPLILTQLQFTNIFSARIGVL